MQPLTTERLHLRPFVPDDLEDAYAFFSDAEVMRFSLNGPHTSRKTTEDFIASNINRQARLGFSLWAVVEAVGGSVIGFSGLAPFTHGVEGIELGYRFRRDRWGRGYATEAGKAAVAFGFGPAGLDRLIAVIEPANVASVRVAEKCGFHLLEARNVAGKDARVYEQFRDETD